MVRNTFYVRREAKLGHDFCRRTLDCLAVDDWRHRNDGSTAGPYRLTGVRHSQDGIDAEPRIRRTHDDAGQRCRGQRTAHLRRETGLAGAVVVQPEYAGPALSAHEVILKCQSAGVAL